MTTYILAGGCDRRYPQYMSALARVIQTEVNAPRILSCWFSNPDDEAPDKFASYSSYFLQNFAQGTTVKMAEADSFLEQVAEADMVYFHGGHSKLLLDKMQHYGDMKAAFEGKIIVGSSAGAVYLSSMSYSPTARAVVQGSGATSLNTVVHYGSEGFGDKTFESSFWHEATEAVRAASDSGEVVVLPEGTFIVVKQQGL